MLPTNKYSAPSHALRDRQSERALMRQLFLISYPLCLIAATSHRIALHFTAGSTRPEQSVFAEARSAAYAAVGYAFHA
ncbi:hypothetical protein J5J10_21820 [Ciceribacter sp. L1K23]|uniref:hypothetical protein n=1 Tax=unclassified Ciceribacter TaxID=2628820 RepID=UPI001ABECD72|nr:MULTISPECIES: hypothetical protein [unclassified Ciceribacter]MBO3761752.1 hypothetical protein [Ciceribacter sp. L1K22]MBR0558341.1 hypothetical protein [Ciceribacter sp. L1K23]